MLRWVSACIAIISIWCGAVAAGAAADPAMSFTYYSGQIDFGIARRFQWVVLEQALERTRDKYGDFTLVALPQAPTSRQKYELSRPASPVNVGVFPSAGDETGIVPVRIPVDIGLLSYRVLLIREEDQPRFEAVHSLDDLKGLKFGLLPWWTDARVMAANGLDLVMGQDYEGLFRMLAAGRFDAFSRGLPEVVNDFEHGRDLAPGLAIERHLLLHYLLPVYFWFGDDEAGRRRAERVRSGLEQMVEDGSLTGMAIEYFGPGLARLDLSRRLTLDLSNPLLDKRDPVADPRLWFHPRMLRPRRGAWQMPGAAE